MPRLTHKMAALYAELQYHEREIPGCTVECRPAEWRTAKALERKGLIEVSEQSEYGSFEAKVRRTTCPTN